MQRYLLSFTVLFATILIATTAMAKNHLLIEGTGDSQQLLQRLGYAFETRNPDTKIIIPDTIGSSGGVKALINGKCDMARVARPIKEKELALADDLVYREFAFSPVVFAANLPDNCVNSLSSAQIVAIFSGSIGDWSELGNCPPHKIYVAIREAGDSSRTVIEKNIPEFESIPQFAGKTLYSTPETAQIIAATPFSIGFLPQSATNSKMLLFALNGVAPGEETVLNGSYPLTSPFSLVWRGELSDLGARFLAFIFGPEGKEIIRSLGVVPVSLKQ